MNQKKEQKTDHLSAGLETLQQVLDNPETSSDTLSAPALQDIIDQHESTDDIGTLSPASPASPLSQSPGMLSVVAAAAKNAYKSSDTTPEAERPQGSNPFLPDETLDRLAYERKAAADTAASALDVMAKVAEQKKQRQEQTDTQPAATTRRRSAAIKEPGLMEKEQLIDELVDEMMPALEARLRAKLSRIL